MGEHSDVPAGGEHLGELPGRVARDEHRGCSGISPRATGPAWGAAAGADRSPPASKLTEIWGDRGATSSEAPPSLPNNVVALRRAA